MQSVYTHAVPEYLHSLFGPLVKVERIKNDFFVEGDINGGLVPARIFHNAGFIKIKADQS